MKTNLFTDNNFCSIHNATRDGTSWRASNNDPHFILNNADGFGEGLWRIELKMRCKTDALPKLYFDFGNGFSETQCQPLEHIKGASYSSVVKFDVAPIGVRFDPIDKEDEFSVETLTVNRLSLIHKAAFSLTGKGRVNNQQAGELDR